MELEYRRDLERQYVIVDTGKKIDFDSYQTRMAMDNHIDGLIRFDIIKINSKDLLKYDITGRQSFASLYESIKLGSAELEGFVRAILALLDNLSGFMLDPDGICLDNRLIFRDIADGSISFCYMPDAGSDFMKGIRELAEYFLVRLNHDDRYAVEMGYGLYRLIMQDGVSRSQIMQVVDFSKSKSDEAKEKEGEDMARYDCSDVRERQIQRDVYGIDMPGESFDNKLKDSRRFIVVPLGVLLFLGALLVGNGFFGVKINLKAVAVAVILLGAVVAAVYIIRIIKKPGEKIGNAAVADMPVRGGFSQRDETMRFRDELKNKNSVKSPGSNRHVKLKNKIKKVDFDANSDGKPEPGRYRERFSGDIQGSADGVHLSEQALKTGFSQSPYMEQIPLAKNNTDPSENIGDFGTYNSSFEDAQEIYGKSDSSSIYDSQKLDYSGETTCLREPEPMQYPMLLSHAPDRYRDIIIDIERSVLLIGKLESVVDLAIPIQTISRIHAKIRMKDTGLFISDMNSKNGTFVNGCRLENAEEHMLKEGDEVCFADVKYTFAYTHNDSSKRDNYKF